MGGGASADGAAIASLVAVCLATFDPAFTSFVPGATLAEADAVLKELETQLAA